MGKIYVLSSRDLSNHAVIFETKEVVDLPKIKQIVGFENLEIEYEADFTGFQIGNYEGYLGFDDSTNDLLSINHPASYIGYINSTFSQYQTTISPFIFRISTEEASIKIAGDYHDNHSASKTLSRKINDLIKEKNQAQSEWQEWFSLVKEKGRNEVKQLEDKFWNKFIADTEVQIKEFYEKNPYVKIKKPTGIVGFLLKIKFGEEEKFKQFEDENWINYFRKCQNFIKSLIPDDENLSEIKLPCLFCKTDDLVYKPDFNDFRNNVTIDGVVLEDISTKITVLEAYCQKCESQSEIPLYMKTKIFPKSNLSRWTSIWWQRFKFWGGY